MSVYEAIQMMKQYNAEEVIIPVEGLPPMSFVCTFSQNSASVIDIGNLSFECSQDLQDFWCETISAILFEDKEYGQWGLEIFNPKQAADFTEIYRTERERDFLKGDLVIGRFLGDSDLLVIRCDSTTSDFGSIIVALPLDPRSEWDFVEQSFANFIENYAKSNGEKYWEQKRKDVD